jgi:hypothetical protein
MASETTLAFSGGSSPDVFIDVKAMNILQSFSSRNFKLQHSNAMRDAAEGKMLIGFVDEIPLLETGTRRCFHLAEIPTL